MSKIDDINAKIDNFEGRDLTASDYDNESEMRFRKVQAEHFRRIRETFDKLGDFANGGKRGIIRTAFVAEMFREHRFIQDVLIQELLGALGDLGKLYQDEPVRFTDGRNEFAYKLCLKVREALKEELFWNDK